MKTFLKTAGVAAALALAPVVASAAVVTVVNGGTYDVNAGNTFAFDEDFFAGTVGTTLTFTFENSGPGGQMTALTFATVQQGTAHFTGGADFTFGTDSKTVAQGTTEGFTLETVIAGLSSEVLEITFGDVVSPKSTGFANIDFQVAAVPLPAGGLLLLSGLAGAAALRRRKNKAA